MVPGIEVLGMRSLAQVVAELRDEAVPEAPPVAAMSGTRLLAWRGQTAMEEVDLADLAGMDDARYAVEVAAAGGHHLLLSGPKGSGKTSIAERIPGLLPDLTREESLELTAVHSLAGALEPGDAHADPAAVRRTAPRRQHGQPGRRRVRPGPAGRDQPGPLRRAVPRRVPPVPGRRRSRRCASRSRTATSPSPAAEESVVLPGAGAGRPRGQPVPVRRLPPRCAASARAPAARSSAATTGARSAARSPTGSTSPATSTAPDADGGSATRSRSRSPPPRSGPGSRRPRARQADRYAEDRLAAQRPRPGPRPRAPLAADARGRPGSWTTSCGTGS